MEFTEALPLLLSCIQLAMSIMEIVILGMDPSGLFIGTRKRSRSYVGQDKCIGHNFMDKCIMDESGMEFPHANQMMDLLAWRIGWQPMLGT